MFIATKIILSRQMFVVTKDAFVATKIMLVAVPANDTMYPALKPMAPQFVRDYVKHVSPTHPATVREEKKELDEKQRSFSPSTAGSLQPFSLSVMLGFSLKNCHGTK